MDFYQGIQLALYLGTVVFIYWKTQGKNDTTLTAHEIRIENVEEKTKNVVELDKKIDRLEFQIQTLGGSFKELTTTINELTKTMTCYRDEINEMRPKKTASRRRAG